MDEPVVVALQKRPVVPFYLENGGIQSQLDAFEKKRSLASTERRTLIPLSRSLSLGIVRNVTDMILNYLHLHSK
jgi:hypothetical protein